MQAFVGRLLVSCIALALALLQSDGCGFEPPPEKGPGEPCTRSDECEARLVCSGGVCMEPVFDAGPPPTLDASLPDGGRDAAPFEPGPMDASLDAALDASADAAPRDAALDASAPTDASGPDAARLDAAPDASLDAAGG